MTIESRLGKIEDGLALRSRQVSRIIIADSKEEAEQKIRELRKIYGDAFDENRGITITFSDGRTIVM